MTQAELKKTFYSNGKLLITGEYTVLDGAKALALPTKGGQYLDITPNDNSIINWKSYDSDGSVWYESEFPLTSVFENIPGDNEVTTTLTNILHQAWLTNPYTLNDTGYTVETRLTFPKNWGLGTSSTLINNIAQWFKIDAFDLLAKSFGGSGYDIACAQNDTAIVYHLDEGNPITELVTFNPAFTDKLYFVYLNRKQNSRQAIIAYRERRNSIAPIVSKINILTESALKAYSMQLFSASLQEHEAIMSGILGLPTIKSLVFPDFKGTIKSLGAWGGDFVLAVSEENPIEYFTSKGFETIVPYSEMILG